MASILDPAIYARQIRQSDRGVPLQDVVVLVQHRHEEIEMRIEQLGHAPRLRIRSALLAPNLTAALLALTPRKHFFNQLVAAFYRVRQWRDLRTALRPFLAGRLVLICAA